MKKKYSKYRTLRGFDNKSRAEQFVAELGEGLYSVYERHWADRDKRRFYVRELVKKGRKRS